MVGSPNTLHPWHALLGLIFGGVLAFGGCSPRIADAKTVVTTQAEAYALCIAASAARTGTSGCGMVQDGDGSITPPAGSGAFCPAGMGIAGNGYGMALSGGGGVWLDGGEWGWCVPGVCLGHDSGSPDQQWAGSEPAGDRCNDGCMSSWRPAAVSSVCLGGVGGQCDSFGHYVGNGDRCVAADDASLSKFSNPKPVCDPGHVSCYNPDRGFCSQTESGETICEPAPAAGSGGCAAGATGTVCIGNGTPPPAPSDPPIPKNSPPDSSSSATVTGGGSTNNLQINNYSGTSPGGSGSESGPPGTSSPGGTASNQDGNGNSGAKGTNSSGVCPDGSVPTASGCSGTYRDDGCDHPPACYGDAVLCGIAVNTHDTACAKAASGASSGGYGDVSSALAGAGVPADGGASGDPSASSLVTSSDLGSEGFDSTGLGFSHSCPAPPSFEFEGRTFTLNIQPVCDWASLFGYLVLLLAYLAGLKIVSTGKA